MNSGGGTNSLLNKKGFTLIELLAVIVILAIILMITLPIILNLINTARYGAFGVSKKNIERAAELYYLSNNNKVLFDGNIAYIEIGELKERGYISKSIAKILDQEEISDEVKVLLYKRGKNIEYHLQMYDDSFLKWYQSEMIKGVKKEGSLPSNVGDKIQIELIDLMTEKRVSELRIPSNLKMRCEGYVDVEKTTNDKYEYNAYVDCLEEANSFASHYVSYGGKYLDEFRDVKETSDGGYIAVGRSNSEVITKYGIGNNGKYDAIIVKFDKEGNVEWSRNFGGSNDDLFNAVVEDLNGYVAVGQTSSNDGDIEDYKGGNNDAIIVKYNKQGEVAYKRSYGSSSIDVNGGSEIFTDIIIDNNNYVIIGMMAGYGRDGDLAGVTGLIRGDEGIIIKMDLEFNMIWRKFFVGSLGENFNKITKTNDNYYMVVGASNSKDYDMEGIGYITTSYQSEGIILKYDNNGNLTKKQSFQGSKNEYFYDIVEVNDGYIIIGHSQSNDQDMEGLSKADNQYWDAIIVKYDKNIENIIWKKTFGGSDDDVFNGVIKTNDNEVVIVGYSKSKDMDMNGLNNLDGYSKSIIVKYNTNNGTIIKKEAFGGNSSDLFSKIIKTSDNKYVIAGSTYSKAEENNKFNKGHSDAILVSYDSNLNLVKTFKEPVILIDVLKKIESNYGTNINLKYDNIYTSNDPTKDLTNWCTSYIPLTEGNTSNYYYGNCLRAFNLDDMKLLVEREVSIGLKIYQGEYEYVITKEASNKYNWYMLNLFNGGSGGNMEYSKLKLKFEDGYVGHITDAIDKGYIEPLVIVNSVAYTNRPGGLLINVIDIINENGGTGVGNYPVMYIHIKPKKSKLSSVVFTSSRDSAGVDGLRIYELRNFDMSITPTN